MAEPSAPPTGRGPLAELETLQRQVARLEATATDLAQRLSALEAQRTTERTPLHDDGGTSEGGVPRADAGLTHDQQAITEIVNRVLEERAFNETLAIARSSARLLTAELPVPDFGEEQLAQILARLKIEVKRLQERFGFQLLVSESNRAAFEVERERLHREFLRELAFLYGDVKVAIYVFNASIGYEGLRCDREVAARILGRD